MIWSQLGGGLTVTHNIFRRLSLNWLARNVTPLFGLNNYWAYSTPYVGRDKS